MLASDEPYVAPPAFPKLWKILSRSTALASILPYVEQEALYQAVLVNGLSPGAVSPDPGSTVKVFQNPLDPSPGYPSGYDSTCSYVTNAQVFSMPRSLTGGVPDGLSNTVFLTEQNARMALKIADRGYVLITGEIVREGAAKALLADDTIVSTYLGH